MPPCTIAPASDAALPAVLALLAPVVGPSVRAVVARDADGAIAGAGGLCWESWGDPAGMPMWVTVLPDRRSQGIGRALAERVVADAAGETDGLWAARPLVEGSEAAGFAAACGFAAERRQLYFEMDAPRFLAHVASIVERLRQRNRIPADTRIAPLSAETRDDVLRLYRAQLAAAPPDLPARLDAALAGDPATTSIDRERSMVLRVGGEVAGALLTRRDANGRDGHIIGNVVGPGWRGGWANAMLLEATTRRGVDGDAADRFFFDCDEASRDTVGLAVRGGATRLRTEILYRYAIAGAPA